jgi:hypothetical protein
MQTPLLAGREFTERDSRESPAVAVVNEAFAQRHFPNQNPLGQYLSANVRGERRELEIVGLVKNANNASLRGTPRSIVYVSYAQLSGDFPTTLEIRASGSVGQVASALRHIIQEKLPNAPVEVRALSGTGRSRDGSGTYDGYTCERIRDARADPVVHWALRLAGVYRHQTHAGDGHTNGARRTAA